MSTEDEQPPKTLGPGWNHLFPGGADPRSAEERQAAQARENRRRRGGDRNWWKREQPVGVSRGAHLRKCRRQGAETAEGGPVCVTASHVSLRLIALK